ncbi:MAG: hypothetical protein JNK72_08575 [Myxococcales bacterium]|nr:hypothetical protein [Myxococcales bacterium]
MKWCVAALWAMTAGCVVHGAGPAGHPGATGAMGATTASNTAQNGGCPGNQVTFYDDEGLRGASLSVAPGRYDAEFFNNSPVQNDTVRSVCVPARCTVTLYEHANFEGAAHSYAQSALSLGDFNGSASSAVIACQ